MTKKATDLHSKVAYGHQGIRPPRTRMVMGIYQQWASSNYGHKNKTKTEPSAREKAEAAFKPYLDPSSEPIAVPFQPFFLPKEKI